MDTALGEKMRELAKTREGAVATELRERADAFDAATKGFMSEPKTVDVKSFFGAWARARRVWCRETGEELL